MMPFVYKCRRMPQSVDRVLMLNSTADLKACGLRQDELRFVRSRVRSGEMLVWLNRYSHQIGVLVVGKKDIEDIRNMGHQCVQQLNKLNAKSFYIGGADVEPEKILAMAEGAALSAYRFNRYFTDEKKKKKHEMCISSIHVHSTSVKEDQIEKLNAVIQSVYWARDMVNEPNYHLTASVFARHMKKEAEAAGCTVEIMGKAKIKSLKMGGLLAVNKGSTEDPAFIIIEWAPKKAVNKAPVVLVGKGLTYDTGGLSLKPTRGSMDSMKSDMAGGAAAAASVMALARSEAPVHVIALIPSTDNRPGGNAYAPGDVITMYNGRTVEVMNTDAEGRLILADALSYATSLNPELVFDMATLTGSAVRALGTDIIAGMGHAPTKYKKAVEQAGLATHERVVFMPFWDDYADQLKSNIADICNIGSINAGLITAGKFLEYFTLDAEGRHSYQWIHLDIAGPAFLDSSHTYRPKGGTGAGVRLIYRAITDLYSI